MTQLAVVLDDAAGRHSAEPLPHVALVEASGIGDLLARRWLKLRHRVEQAGPVANADHQRQVTVVEYACHLDCESALFHLVQLLSRHVNPPCTAGCEWGPF